eukprot:GHVT01044284.1.p2 GENE.GHVT01044284.1~~GHVT01044284.1.p2  ORF type:complete len:231 (+),score=27.41 GHVT01044284.1:1226-1918(+)
MARSQPDDLLTLAASHLDELHDPLSHVPFAARYTPAYLAGPDPQSVNRELRLDWHQWAMARARTAAQLRNCYSHHDPAWDHSRTPLPYLSMPLARYGMLFRLHSLGPADKLVAACVFCQRPLADCGLHLITACAPTLAAHPLPPSLDKEVEVAAARMAKTPSNDDIRTRALTRLQYLRLHQKTPPCLLTPMLKWRQAVWHDRTLRRGGRPRLCQTAMQPPIPERLSGSLR